MPEPTEVPNYTTREWLIYAAGVRHGYAAGRDEAEDLLLDQDRMMDEIVLRHIARVLAYADIQRLAQQLSKLKRKNRVESLGHATHADLVQRRDFRHEGPAGPAATKRIVSAAEQHQRVWEGWPQRGAAPVEQTPAALVQQDRARADWAEVMSS